MLSAEATEAITTATELLATTDSLTAATTLRARHLNLDSEQASAALTQATLRRLARERYGLTGALLLTRDGLEQATRPQVARLRGQVLAESGVRHVVDATAGLGFDSRGFLDAGLEVTCIERDPQTAAFLAHNLPSAHVVVGDAVDILNSMDLASMDLASIDLASMDLASTVVFVDPARRDHRRSADGSRAHPERDPERWSPPWSWVEALTGRVRVVAKVAPGFTAPAGWQCSWTSVDRTVVEAMVASWPLFTSPARAVAFVGDHVEAIDVDESATLALAPSLSAYVHEPDPAVIRAGGIDSLGGLDPTLARLDSAGTWLTSSQPSSSILMRSYRVLEVLPADRKKRRRSLADRGITSATIKTRDVDTDPKKALRDLGLTEGSGAMIVLCRQAGEVRAVLVASEAAAPEV